MAIQKGYGPGEYASLIMLWEEWLGIEVLAKNGSGAKS